MMARSFFIQDLKLMYSEIRNPQSKGGFAGFGPLTACLFFLHALGCQKRFDIFYKINPDLIFRIAELVGDEGYN
jgi:hypothetical protein